jgi:ATP-dependent Zn protease
MQVSGPSSYYPMQTTGTDWSSMFSSMMPMIMMIMMMAMLMPMMKGMTGSARD